MPASCGIRSDGAPKHNRRPINGPTAGQEPRRSWMNGCTTFASSARSGCWRTATLRSRRSARTWATRRLPSAPVPPLDSAPAHTGVCSSLSAAPEPVGKVRKDGRRGKDAAREHFGRLRAFHRSSDASALLDLTPEARSSPSASHSQCLRGGCAMHRDQGGDSPGDQGRLPKRAFKALAMAFCLASRARSVMSCPSFNGCLLR